MNETVRHALKARVQLSDGLVILGCALLFVSVRFWHSGPNIAVLLVGCVAMVVGATLRLSVRCPKCAYLLGRPRNFCPNCGISLDKPRP